MTVYNGVNYAKTQQQPIEQLDEGQYNSPTFHILDQFVLTADLAAADTILMGGPIPEGATLLDAILTTGALGGSCTVSLGWQASPAQPAGSLAGQAADLTAFFNTVAVSSASVLHAHGSAQEGDFYTQTALQGQVQPILTCVAVSSGATGKSIMIDISYCDNA
jgi:hypothetical protein